MSAPPPRIEMDAGLEIGYGTPLAHIGTKIQLNSGTHFLVARNGRGKTTLLRTLAGSIKPVSGHFEMHGFVQYLAENIRFDQELPTKRIFHAMLPKDGVDDAFALADRTELDVAKPYGKLSTGNKRKANLIVAECSTRPDAESVTIDKKTLDSLVIEIQRLGKSNETLRDQLAELNRDLMQLKFRVDTHSESFRPLPVNEEQIVNTSEEQIEEEASLLPPLVN